MIQLRMCVGVGVSQPCRDHVTYYYYDTNEFDFVIKKEIILVRPDHILKRVESTMYSVVM